MTTKKIARGMDWEATIIDRCEKYKKENKAYIFKLPTDWRVIRKNKFIISAFPKSKSLVDFFGILNDGRAICLEAKSTNNKTSFPFSNIAIHQFDFFNKINEFSHLNYFLIRFKTLDKNFFINSSKILEAKNTLKRKSIPLSWFYENSIELDENLNFLEAIE